jgi:hypothetical protein
MRPRLDGLRAFDGSYACISTSEQDFAVRFDTLNVGRHKQAEADCSFPDEASAAPPVAALLLPLGIGLLLRHGFERAPRRAAAPRNSSEFREALGDAVLWQPRWIVSPSAPPLLALGVALEEAGAAHERAPAVAQEVGL